MKKLFLFIISLHVLVANGQTECYSSDKYSYLDSKSSNDDLTEIKKPIGICFSNKYVSIKINGDITTFPIQEVSISKRKDSDGALVYSFLTDRTNLYSIGYYSIEIVYGKIRIVAISNTIAGTLYLMQFKTNKYHYLKEKDFNNLDSLGKAITKEKYKPTGMGDVGLCKYCDGVVWKYYGGDIYCGRCKKDTNGVSMYDIWDKRRTKTGQTK